MGVGISEVARVTQPTDNAPAEGQRIAEALTSREWDELVGVIVDRLEDRVLDGSPGAVADSPRGCSEMPLTEKAFLEIEGTHRQGPLPVQPGDRDGRAAQQLGLQPDARPGRPARSGSWRQSG